MECDKLSISTQSPPTRTTTAQWRNPRASQRSQASSV
jgi:hypothetical protein